MKINKPIIVFVALSFAVINFGACSNSDGKCGADVECSCETNSDCVDAEACSKGVCVPIDRGCEPDEQTLTDGCQFIWSCQEGTGDWFKTVSFECDADGKCECSDDGVSKSISVPEGTQVCSDLARVEDLTNQHCERAIRGSRF